MTIRIWENQRKRERELTLSHPRVLVMLISVSVILYRNGQYNGNNKAVNILKEDMRLYIYDFRGKVLCI